jgi:hypothetical protein
MLLNKETGRIIMRVLREHQPVPQNCEFFPDGSVVMLCKCSDINEYNSNGYTDHLTVQVLDELSMADMKEKYGASIS